MQPFGMKRPGTMWESRNRRGSGRGCGGREQDVAGAAELQQQSPGPTTPAT